MTGVLVVIVLSLPFAYILVRHPMLRRLAVRNATRRPRETALVIAGSLLGTAIITGSFVVGDTIDASIRALAYTQLGGVDEVVAAGDPRQWREVRSRLEALPSAAPVDGLLPLTTLAVSASAGSGDALRALPAAQLLEVDFAEATAFGWDNEDFDRTPPDTPAPGHAVVTAPVADVLQIETGDAVTVYAFGEQQQLVVDAVVAQEGVTGFWLGQESRSYNLLVGPGTIDPPATRGGPSRFAPPSWLVAISNEGGIEDGADRTPAVEAAAAELLDGLPVRVQTVKADLLDDAEAAAEFGQIFSAMGSFGVMAGILLLVNIFVMLAEERKRELGMLRAVGMRRTSLVGAAVTEGWTYALAAAAVGTLAGLGLGRIIMAVMAGIFTSAEATGFALDIRFSYDVASLGTSFAVGFTIALVTVLVTSTRTSRFNIIQAIRELPPTRRPRPRLAWLVAASFAVLAGGLITFTGFAVSNATALLVGPVVALTALVPLVSRSLPRVTTVTVVALLCIGWGAFVPSLDIDDDSDFIVFFVLQGVVLTAAAVALVSQHQQRIGRAMGHLGSLGRSLALRLGTAYPVAKVFRTALILGMYSLVIFTLTFITVLSHQFGDQIDQTSADIAAGFDVYVQSNESNPVDLNQLEGRAGVAGVAPLVRSFGEFTRRDMEGAEPVPWPVAGFDERYLELGPPELEDRGDYASDEEAYRAVLDDPSLIIADEFALQMGGGPPADTVEPGDTLLLVDPFTGVESELTVAALGQGDWLFNGMLAGATTVRELFGARAVASRAYVALEDGADALAFSAEVEADHVANGVRADPIRGLVAAAFAFQDQIFRLFQGYLALGLVVGIAGLGVVMVRAVRERRREIGMLRALGFQARTVRRSFVLESGFVAIEGTLIGVSLALLTAYQLTATEAFGDGIPFSIPVVELTILAAGTLLASLLATAAPASAAARIRPAVALRTVD